MEQPVGVKDNLIEKKEKKPGVVLLSGYWNSSSDGLLNELQKFEKSNMSESDVIKTVHLVCDEEALQVGSSGYNFEQIDQEIRYGAKDKSNQRNGRNDLELIIDVIKDKIEKIKNKNDNENDKILDWASEFYKYLINNVSEEDINKEGNGYQNINDYANVFLKKESLFGFLRNFLQTKGYNMEILYSYKKIPANFSNYKKLDGNIALPFDLEEKILEELKK